MSDHDTTIAEMKDLAAEAGLRRVTILAWRDLDDPEAGGSEVSAAMTAKFWAEAGLEVKMRSSFAVNHPSTAWRDGYRVVRKAGRYAVFPRAAFSEAIAPRDPSHGLVEHWNGMPFFSPVWSRNPRITMVHHVHGEMWRMTLPPRLAALGNFIESTLAPPLYRRTAIVTPSESSKSEMVEVMGFSPARVTVVQPGIDSRFTPGGTKSPTPLIAAVGRLVPVKQFHALIDVAVQLKRKQPALEVVIAGEGYERDHLEERIFAANAESWIKLPGRISDEELVDLYRRAWAVASASAREGWGLTITEAAACGTTAVATRIVGHLDAVDDGQTGLLTDDAADMVECLDRLIRDDALRTRLSYAAGERASSLTWERSALNMLAVLAQDAVHRRERQSRR
jgi:glycosyltransferase involved in cell wall biosynthesis